MPYRDDKVADVLAVLKVMRDGFKKGLFGRDSTELRKDAVRRVAESELQGGRYKNLDSALKTIHDACARRLKRGIKNFDDLADKWLSGQSMRLKDILLAFSEDQARKAEVRQFFGD